MTKADDAKEEELHLALESVFTRLSSQRLNSCLPFVHVVSAKTGEGIVDLQLSMAEIFSQKWMQNDSIVLPMDQLDLDAAQMEELTSKISHPSFR